MPEYEFYREEYGGRYIADAAEFAVFAVFAEKQVAQLEWLYTVSYPTPQSRALAVCAVAEERARMERVQDEGNVKQVSVGSVSTTYEHAGSAKADAYGQYYNAAAAYCNIYRGLREAHT